MINHCIMFWYTDGTSTRFNHLTNDQLLTNCGTANVISIIMLTAYDASLLLTSYSCHSMCVMRIQNEHAENVYHYCLWYILFLLWLCMVAAT